MVENDKFDEFLEEVEHDIREEKYRQLWQKYGKQVSTGFTAVLVLLAAYTLWSNYSTKEELRQSDYYLRAQQYLAEGKHTQALAILKEVGGGNHAYGLFAKFSEAAILADPGEAQDIDKAIALYKEISASSKIDQLWRDVATLQAISLEFQKDPSKSEALLKSLDPLIADGSPLQALALEHKGIILYALGKKAEAGEIFVKLVQIKDAPEGLVMRAQLMSQQIASEIG